MREVTPKEVAIQYGYAEYMIQRYFTQLGVQETIALLEANEKPLNPTIYINRLLITVEELETRLKEKGFKIERLPGLKAGLRILKAPFSIGATTEYLLGYYTIQGAASMLAVECLTIQPEDRVIDMCAAPGIKTIQLAQKLRNQGILLAIDRSEKRLRALQANIARCRIKNVISIQFDARKLSKLKYTADKILLDAPCTGSGIIRKDVTRKTSRELEDITRLAEIQKQLISAGITSLKEGGTLVYSTCSLEPEENEEIINYAVEKYSVELEEPILQFGSKGLLKINKIEFSKDLEKTRRLWPHRHNSEGFFIGVLRKCPR